MQHFIVNENAYLPYLESLVQVCPFLDSVAVKSSDSTGDSGSVQEFPVLHNPLEHMCTSFANGVHSQTVALFLASTASYIDVA